MVISPFLKYEIGYKYFCDLDNRLVVRWTVKKLLLTAIYPQTRFQKCDNLKKLNLTLEIFLFFGYLFLILLEILPPVANFLLSSSRHDIGPKNNTNCIHCKKCDNPKKIFFRKNTMWSSCYIKFERVNFIFN